MRVALVDPSLFTLPYDRALAAALTRAGDTVTLHGRQPRAEDGETGDIDLSADFYRLAESPRVRRLPGAARLIIKGMDHGASLLRFIGALRARRPEIIHVQWMPLPLLDAPALPLLRRLAPLVLTVHDTRAFNGNPGSFVQRLGFGRALTLFDRLIVHTDQGKARLQEYGIPARRIAVLPHGPLAPARVGAGGGTGPVRFLLFGKIKPYKGADLLIEAFARLPDALRMQARLHIVGQPYMPIEPLTGRAESLSIGDRCEIDSDFVPESAIPALFGPDAIAVFPYREIEASGVLSLAIANGTPIIASRLGAFAETLRHGEHGMLVEPGDIEGLSLAMATMIANADFRARAASAVHALAAAAPSWDQIADGTRRLYRELRATHVAQVHSLPARTAHRAL